MRRLPLVRILFAVLALQLAIGLQVDVAHAMPAGLTDGSATVALADSMAPMTGDHDACPLHGSSSSDSSHARVPHNNSPGGHDCCKSSCQCQCGGLSLAFDVPRVRVVSVTAYIPPARATHVATALADSHFRPPIAA